MKNIKYLLCILVGFILAIGISNAYILNASEVTYDKKNTTLESDNIQSAIEELEDSTIDKKNQIIDALINKGANINSDANYDEIINGINSIKGGANGVYVYGSNSAYVGTTMSSYPYLVGMDYNPTTKQLIVRHDGTYKISISTISSSSNYGSDFLVVLNNEGLISVSAGEYTQYNSMEVELKTGDVIYCVNTTPSYGQASVDTVTIYKAED